MRKRLFKFAVACVLIGVTQISAQEFIPLWPDGKMPNSRGISVEDSLHNERFYQVEIPGVYSFFPSNEENTGAAILIIPGGGYHHITYVLSGTQLAKWFNTFGVNAFVLKYRLPHSPDLEVREIGPVQDAQRAMRLIRSRADAWQINGEKIGVMGISAGGHLASTLGTHSRDVAAIGDSLDRIGFRPDFMIMISPVITMGENTHSGSRENLLGENPSDQLIRKYSNELHVSESTPPGFLVHAANDQAVDPRNSLMFYRALLKFNDKSALHIFPEGGHGIALRNNPGSTGYWTDLCEAWLRELGMVGGNH